MILNGSAQALFNLKKKTTINPGTKKSMYVKCNKTITQLQNFILCNMMCYGARKSNIDRGIRPWSILLFSAP